MPSISIAIGMLKSVVGITGVSTPSNDYDFMDGGNYQFMDGDNYEFN